MREEDTPQRVLSPSQKAYRDDPHGFLARLSERAMGLFASGYRVYPGAEPHVFVVVGHTRKEEVEYRVDALNTTCDCPFFAWQVAGEYLGEDRAVIPCKHLQGLRALVRQTRHWLADSGQVAAYCALSVHWLKYLAFLRRGRIEQEKQEKTERSRYRSSLVTKRTSTEPSAGSRSGERHGERTERKQDDGEAIDDADGGERPSGRRKSGDLGRGGGTGGDDAGPRPHRFP